MINSIKIITATILGGIKSPAFKVGFCNIGRHCSHFIFTANQKETFNTAHINAGTTKKQFCLKFTNLNTLYI